MPILSNEELFVRHFSLSITITQMAYKKKSKDSHSVTHFQENFKIISVRIIIDWFSDSVYQHLMRPPFNMCRSNARWIWHWPPEASQRPFPSPLLVNRTSTAFLRVSVDQFLSRGQKCDIEKWCAANHNGSHKEEGRQCSQYREIRVNNISSFTASTDCSLLRLGNIHF